MGLLTLYRFQKLDPRRAEAMKGNGESTNKRRLARAVIIARGLGAVPPPTAATQAADYDATRGGANPLLGLASGGAFGTRDGALQFSGGDDRLQQQSQGQIVPESFTHGSSAQRVRWFKRGLEGGDLKACDTFSSGQQL